MTVEQLSAKVTAAKAELAEAEQLALRAEQARIDAVAQQLRIQGRIAALEDLIAEESARGES